MVKRCRWSGKRCYFSNCSIFDCHSCDVGICPFHGNPFGFMMRRKVVPILVSVWNKHVLRRGS